MVFDILWQGVGMALYTVKKSCPYNVRQKKLRSLVHFLAGKQIAPVHCLAGWGLGHLHCQVGKGC